MKKYVCDVCGWEYDEELGAPDLGIEPGTKFEDLPDDFECPLCFVGKDQFSENQIHLPKILTLHSVCDKFFGIKGCFAVSAASNKQNFRQNGDMHYGKN